MKRKIKRFDTGGSTGDYSGDDPLVKYRMGKLSKADTYDALGEKDLANIARVKEATKTKIIPAVENKINDTKGEVIDMRSNPKNVISKETRDNALKKNARRFISMGFNPASITPDRLVRADVDNEYPETKKTHNAVAYKDEYTDAGYKKGGTVKRSSASSRGDGIATKGHTRGKVR